MIVDDSTRSIEAWFAEQGDGEFGSPVGAYPYSVVGPSSCTGACNRLVQVTRRPDAEVSVVRFHRCADAISRGSR